MVGAGNMEEGIGGDAVRAETRVGTVIDDGVAGLDDAVRAERRVRSFEHT